MENLIILGAGGYGRTAAETARAMGVFGRVAFLDDGCTGTDILGPCTDYIRFAGEFRWAYPAFGANALRAAWLEKLAAAGYSLPALVHPRAYVSPTADIRPGAVVLALAAVGACAVVEQGAIVNMGGDRGPRLCGRRVRPPCARGHCQGRQHRARADEDRIRHRARTGRGIFTIGGTACLNF